MINMAKESAYFTVGGISGKHDVKEIKRGLDTLPGVLSVSVGGGRVAVDFDTTGTRREKPCIQVVSKQAFRLDARKRTITV